MNSIARLDDAVRALAEARSLDEIQHIRNMAKAAEEYARAEKLGKDAERYAREIRLRAARKAGELLIQMADNGELKRPVHEDATASHRRRSQPVVIDDRLVGLAELGLTRDESSRWQRIAKVPDERFEEAVKDGMSETAVAAMTPTTPRPVRDAVKERLPIGMQKRTGLKAQVRLQRISETLEGYADALPEMHTRGEDVADVLRAIEHNASRVKTAARHLREGLEDEDQATSSNGASI